MNTIKLGKLLAVLVGMIFLISGCSSLDKARSLHREGKDGEALEMAAKYLRDGDKDVRLEAVNLVGDIGGNKAGKLLMPLMNDENEEVKNAAIKNIGKLKYAPASKKLVSMSLTSKGDTFEEVAGAIRNIGPPAIDLLVKRYNKTKDPIKRDEYKKVMLEVGPSVAEGIAKTLAGKSFFENKTNFELLIAFKNPMVANWMLKEITNEEVADMVVEGLVKLGKNAVIPVMKMLRKYQGHSGEVELKERLIRILGDLRDQRSVPLLIKMTEDNSERVSNTSESALRKIRGF